MNYATPSQNRYAFMLDGVDDRWRYSEISDRIVTYTNLDPGTYLFRVKGGVRGERWNDEETTLTLTVRPPPWKTWWAFTLYGFALVLLVTKYIRSQRGKLAQERELNEILDKKVAERTRDLEQKNREITKHEKQLVVQSEKLEEQAKKLQKMDELKTRFFINASHELRTPLMLALGPIEDALWDPKVEGQLRRHFEIASRNGRQLIKLLNEILDISKLESGQMALQTRRGNFASFVKRCADTFIPLAERKVINLVFQTDSEEITAYFDPDKIEKVISNLMANAFKYTPKKGKVLVDILGTEPDWICVTVRDTGVGISRDQLPHIFDRFYQAGQRDGVSSVGTGIGLSLAHELVGLHGGEIMVKSDLGFGSQFKIRLPKGKAHLEVDQILEAEVEPSNNIPVLDVPDDRPPDQGADSDSHEHPKQATILLVEDHADVRIYIRDHLAKDYHVLEAATGEDGLKLALEKIPDLVLSDVMMARMDGLTLCQNLKEDARTSHIPVILLTAKASVEANIAGFEMGADDYLLKPFQARVLLSRIANLLESRRKLREQFSKEMILQPSKIKIASTDVVFLKKAVSVVEQHLQENGFGVYELADELGFSRRQLHRKLSALTGRAPTDFIRRIRLERAAQMLEQHAGNISEVAHAVGFQQRKYFSTLFREAFGKTPSEFIESLSRKVCKRNLKEWESIAEKDEEMVERRFPIADRHGPFGGDLV